MQLPPFADDLNPISSTCHKRDMRFELSPPVCDSFTATTEGTQDDSKAWAKELERELFCCFKLSYATVES